jgi:hypothetical protein
MTLSRIKPATFWLVGQCPQTTAPPCAPKRRFQHATTGVVCKALQFFFSNYLNWRQNSLKKHYWSKSILSFSLQFFFCNIFHSKKNWARHDKKCTHYSCYIVMELECSTHIFKKKPQISNLMKIHPVKVKSFHVNGLINGQRFMTKTIVAFWNFANVPKSANQLFNAIKHRAFPIVFIYVYISLDGLT